MALTPKQTLFVAEYLANGLNATQAAISAGYSAKTAESQASRLLRNVKVAEAIDEAQSPTLKRLGITKEFVLETIVSTITRCQQVEAVTYRGVVVPGEFQFDAANVLKGSELLGRHLKMFTDKAEVSGPEGGPVEHSVAITFIRPNATDKG